MKHATPIAVLLGCLAISLAIGYSTHEGAHYQIVALNEGRIARLDRRSGRIDYCSVRVVDDARRIACSRG